MGYPVLCVYLIYHVYPAIFVPWHIVKRCSFLYIKQQKHKTKQKHIFVTPLSNIQYSQRHNVINHCDRRITHLGDLNISFVLLDISSKFLLHLECWLLSPKRHIKWSKRLNTPKGISVSLRKVIHLSQWIIMLCLWLYCISITNISDMSITVIYHCMSLTVLYQYH